METTPYTTWTAYTYQGKNWEVSGKEDPLKLLGKLQEQISNYCYGSGGDDELSLPHIIELVEARNDIEKVQNAAQLALFNDELHTLHIQTQLEGSYAADAASYERSLMGDRI